MTALESIKLGCDALWNIFKNGTDNCREGPEKENPNLHNLQKSPEVPDMGRFVLLEVANFVMRFNITSSPLESLLMVFYGAFLCFKASF